MWFNGEKLCQASYTELGATSGGGDVECLSVPGIEETVLMQSCFQQRRQKGNSGKIAKICDPFGAELSYSRGRSSIETSRTLNFHGMLKMLFFQEDSRTSGKTDNVVYRNLGRCSQKSRNVPATNPRHYSSPNWCYEHGVGAEL